MYENMKTTGIDWPIEPDRTYTVHISDDAVREDVILSGNQLKKLANPGNFDAAGRWNYTLKPLPDSENEIVFARGPAEETWWRKIWRKLLRRPVPQQLLVGVKNPVADPHLRIEKIDKPTYESQEDYTDWEDFQDEITDAYGVKGIGMETIVLESRIGRSIEIDANHIKYALLRVNGRDATVSAENGIPPCIWNGKPSFFKVQGTHALIFAPAGWGSVNRRTFLKVPKFMLEEACDRFDEENTPVHEKVQYFTATLTDYPERKEESE